MSNYTKSTNFATKDNLSPGDPLKIVRGTEIDTEFNNIATAIATKTDNSAAAITGGSITGITDLAIADGGTGASTATAAINNLLPSQTSNANKYLQTDGTNVSWDAVSLSTSDITGTLPVANGGTGVTTSTGTGSVVLSNSPTLVTPALGTPTSGVATNLTGLPLSTGVTGTLPIANGGTGQTTANAAFNALAPSQATASGKYLKSDGTNTSWDALDISTADITGTLPVANGGTGVTTSTGTGSVVLSNSPTLVTPALGTPSSATLTNATGLPISTGVSGLGTGVATALAVNVGSAGAPVVNGGALGIPSSGTVTNLTGTASININGTVGATTPTTGAFTTVAASSSVTLSGGTANGVTYLNGSKVLTSGSALTFDGTKLGFNGGLIADNNLVAQINSPSTTAKFFGFNRSGDYGLLIGYDNANDYASIRTVFSYPIVFSVNNTEGMRLTSTGLGIGTSSPATKLQVYGGALTVSNESTYAARFGNNSNKGVTIGYDTTNNVGHIGSINPAVSWTDLVINANGGNIGFGVSPNAWGPVGTYVGLQVGPAGGAQVNLAGGDASLGSNFYISAVGTQRYQSTGIGASRYQFYNGTHQWYTAASGTAGNAISFSQAMTLDASGNLLVGKTSVGASNVGFQLNNVGEITVSNTATTNAGATQLNVYSTGASAYRFFVGMGGTIYATSTTITAISDQRLKENIQDIDVGLNAIMALKPRKFDWKAGKGKDKKGDRGWIAQEFEQVFPDMIDTWKDPAPEGEEPYKAVNADLIPVLVKAIQEQQAIIESLKARLDAANL